MPAIDPPVRNAYGAAMTWRLVLPVLALLCGGVAVYGEPGNSFAAFLDGLRADAQRQGITAATFAEAFDGVTPDPNVLGARQHAPEYGKPFGPYIASLASASRIGVGLRKSAQWSATLRAVEQKYGVDPDILVSIWGVESSFGESASRWDVFRSLATLAAARFQHPLFRDELWRRSRICNRVAFPQRVPRLLRRRDGQPQFLPSSYLKYAVDFDGDGKADIWNSVPDVLASTANYIRARLAAETTMGLRGDGPAELRLPGKPGYVRTMDSAWATPRGWCGIPGGWRRDFVFSQRRRPGFSCHRKFCRAQKIREFGRLRARGRSVSRSAARLSRFRGRWPVNDFQPSRATRIALQHRLAALGYKIADFDGHFDFDLRDAVRDLQRRYGMIPDGYPGRTFLDRVGVREP